MAEEQDEQQQQQNLLDVELVRINEQVKIATSNFRIALEKTQPYVIYKVCLEILKQYYFYNDFTITADAPEIYRQEGYNNIDFAELIWEEFKYQIKSRKVSRQKQEQMPFSRFTKLIVKYILSQNDQISKIPLSFHHFIKLDSTLRNLKFANKGLKDPIFGMAILAVMLNDDIKASAEYLEYLVKSKGFTPIKATGRGKVVLTKEGVHVAVQINSIPKRRISKTVTEEVSQSEGVDDDEVDSEDTEEEEEEPLVIKRQSGITISGEAHREYEEGADHSKKLKGLETLSEDAQFYLNEGAGVTLEIPNELSDHSSSLSSYSEFVAEDISSDEVEVTEKTDNEETSDVVKDTENK
ncbi:hypothetical protein Tco_1235703 [Tanacetum coccineum]